MTSQKAKAEQFRQLHHGPDLLVLANVWDAASARIIETEGFPAIATSSAGMAAVLGYPDGEKIPRSEMMFLISKVTSAVDIPVSADVEAGYGDPVQTALEVIASGAIGMNLEDFAGNELLPLPAQLEIIRAVRRASDDAGVPLVINARTDISLAKHGDPATRLDRTAERFNAFLDAGAECVFAPGVTDRETIGGLAAAVKGPLNILATVGSPTLPEMKSLGVKRVSLGSGPARLALGVLRAFVRNLRDHGTFPALETDAIPYLDVNRLMSSD